MNELDILLEEIRDLCEIPEFRKSIQHKVNELKLDLSTFIDDYRDIEIMVRDIAGTREPGHSPMLDGQPFQLTRVGKTLWIPSFPGCSREDGVDLLELYAVVPQEIIDFIVTFEASKGIPVMLPGLTIPGLEGRKFDLTFEKHDDKYYTGIIHEHGGVQKTVGYRFSAGMDIDLKDLKLLITYFKDHPHYFRQIFNSFYKTWKPMLDKLIQDAR